MTNKSSGTPTFYEWGIGVKRTIVEKYNAKWVLGGFLTRGGKGVDGHVLHTYESPRKQRYFFG